MKLITEHTHELEYITESKGKEQYIKGIFMQSDLKNQNGRIYPHAVLKKEVNNFNNKYVKEGRALGGDGEALGGAEGEPPAGWPGEIPPRNSRA